MRSLLSKLGVILISIWLLVFYSHARAQKTEYWEIITIGGKCGYKNQTGKIVIKPQFDKCLNFLEGLATVKIKDKWGFINDVGKYVIDPKFDIPPSFFDGLAMVIEGGKYGYINMTGNYVIEPKFDGAGIFFSEKLANVRVGEKWGYIDLTGNYVIDPKFDDAYIFSEGLAAVKVSNKWGYIDRTGKFIINLQFDDVGDFSFEQLASVKVGDKWGFINKTGNIIIDPKFDSFGYAGPYFIFGKAMVKIDGNIANIDVAGEIISADWMFCCKGKDETTFVYYDPKNASSPSKNIVRVWSRWVNLGEGYKMLLNEIDCLNKTTKILNSTNYAKGGKVINSYSFSPEKSEIDYIVPNSLLEILSRGVCQKKSK